MEERAILTRWGDKKTATQGPHELLGLGPQRSDVVEFLT